MLKIYRFNLKYSQSLFYFKQMTDMDHLSFVGMIQRFDN